jgi:hypothetical protein
VSLAQASDSTTAPASFLDSTLPEVRIQTRIQLPSLPTLNNSFGLNISVARIIGPGSNASSGDPYVEYTGRVYNQAIVPGVARAKQGESFSFIVSKGPGELVSTAAIRCDHRRSAC